MLPLSNNSLQLSYPRGCIQMCVSRGVCMVFAGLSRVLSPPAHDLSTRMSGSNPLIVLIAYLCFTS